MKTNKDINYELVFKGQNNQVLTNSLLVAEKFGKEHSDVLRAIDALVSKMAENQCEGYFAETSVDIDLSVVGIKHLLNIISQLIRQSFHLSPINRAPVHPMLFCPTLDRIPFF